MKRIKVIDSHTGGEPTRIIIEGGPDLGSGPLAERREIFREKFDDIRSAVVNEPRGSDVIVGGLLCEPVDHSCSAGIIFFDTAAYLGMCGHGTIGLMATLKHLGKIGNGTHRLETPVGIVTTEIGDDGATSVENVPSYRLHKEIEVDVPDYGKVIGDVAWGGNWFFLVKKSPVAEQLKTENVRHLNSISLRIRDALADQRITADNGEPVDHVELYGPPSSPQNNSRNFVLCPSGTYDRSPCGTGTSAKLACLAADGKLAAGEIWRQESIVGSVFECSYRPADENGKIIPTIRGSAHVMGESILILDPTDPFCMGIR
jgi:4-hydroxyproline epimerase